MKLHPKIRILLKILATPILLFLAGVFLWLSMVEGITNWWQFILLVAFKIAMLFFAAGFSGLLIYLWDPSFFKPQHNTKPA